MRAADAKRYAAPAAFLAAVTVGVLVARSGLNHRQPPSATQAVPPPARKRVVTTTTPARTSTGEKAAAGARFYTVVAGDTFGVISSKTGVGIERLQQLNPNVRSTALFIGQKLKIR